MKIGKFTSLNELVFEAMLLVLCPPYDADMTLIV